MTDVLLVVLAIALVVGAVFAATHLAVGALRLSAAYFTVSVTPPPGLARIARIIELRQAVESAAAAASRRRDPPPEIVVALRAVTGNGRY